MEGFQRGGGAGGVVVWMDWMFHWMVFWEWQDRGRLKIIV